MHHSIAISEFPGSYVLATDADQVETAVVFVHGFLGHSFDTWIDFQSRIDLETGWEQTDLYFLSYDSFRNSVKASMDVLLRFMAHMEQAPEAWFAVSARSLPPLIGLSLGSFQLRSGPTEYRRILLVGHSLGGVVLREAILHHARRYLEQSQHAGVGQTVPMPRILRSPLRLFAPAISGARPAGLFGMALRLGGFGGLALAVLGGSPSYAELLPENGLIDHLRTWTEKLAERFPELEAFRADVLWAERDDIVIDSEYFTDRLCGRAAGMDHTSVCKPCNSYRQPLDLVVHGHV